MATAHKRVARQETTDYSTFFAKKNEDKKPTLTLEERMAQALVQGKTFQPPPSIRATTIIGASNPTMLVSGSPRFVEYSSAILVMDDLHPSSNPQGIPTGFHEATIVHQNMII
jgi:hypothetical protein